MSEGIAMSDENESREPADRPINRTCRGVTVFVAVLLIYVLSPIPVAWVLRKIGPSNRVEQAYESFYAPLGFFVEHFEFVESFYEWQIKLIDR